MDVGDLVGGRTPEGAGIDPDRDFVRWLKVLVGRGTPEERISARAGTPSGDAAGFVRGMENLTPEGEDIVPGKDSVGGYN